MMELARPSQRLRSLQLTHQVPLFRRKAIHGSLQRGDGGRVERFWYGLGIAGVCRHFFGRSGSTIAIAISYQLSREQVGARVQDIEPVLLLKVYHRPARGCAYYSAAPVCVPLALLCLQAPGLSDARRAASNHVACGSDGERSTEAERLQLTATALLQFLVYYWLRASALCYRRPTGPWAANAVLPLCPRTW